MSNIARTILLSLVIMAAMNAISAVVNHFALPYPQVILAAIAHLAFFTFSATAACLLTGQRTLAVVAFAAILLGSASSPGFNITTVLYPSMGGILLAMITRGGIKDNTSSQSQQARQRGPYDQS